jgi:hypothetical protein
MQCLLLIEKPAAKISSPALFSATGCCHFLNQDAGLRWILRAYDKEVCSLAHSS